MNTKRGKKAKMEWTEEQEAEANTFAAAFLMPEKEFRKVWKEKSGNLISVAERFNVSLTAVKWRAVGLGLDKYDKN